MRAIEAHEYALRALRHRDLSTVELEQRLAAQGFGDSESRAAIETLLRTGLLDDDRFAQARAVSLAARGAGDAFIRHALGRAGVPPEHVERALATVEPEVERALRIVERRGTGSGTARYLRGKGFSDESIASAVAGESAFELG